MDARPHPATLLSQLLVAFTMEADAAFEVAMPHRAALPHFPIVTHRGGYPDGS
jgi:hypothetical protein